MPIDTQYIDGPEPEFTDEEIAALRAKLADLDAAPRGVTAPPPSRMALPRRTLPRKLVTVRFQLDGWAGTFEVPSVNYLTQREQQGVARGDDEIIRSIFGDLADVIQDMTNDEVQAFAAAWRDASGVTSGESPAA
uniref:Tail assembly chaperone n=1 Tax=Dulem virus 32 TaxID=3145750 RepID=A0AAU8B2K1_9CAUD